MHTGVQTEVCIASKQCLSQLQDGGDTRHRGHRRSWGHCETYRLVESTGQTIKESRKICL